MKGLLRFAILSILAALIAFGGFTGTAYASGGEMPHHHDEPQKQLLIKKESGQKGEYLVELFIEANPQEKDHGALIIAIKDAKNEAVKDAQATAAISMDQEMHGHGAMSSAPQDVMFVLDEESGHYKAEIELTEMAMETKVNIAFPDGYKESLNLTLEAGYDGPNLIFLWSIFGIIVISIIIAQVIKARQQQPKGGEANVGA